MGFVESAINIEFDNEYKNDYIWMIIDNNEVHNVIEKGDFVLFSLRDHKIVYRRSDIVFKGEVLNAIFDLENDFVYFITSKGINRTKALW